MKRSDDIFDKLSRKLHGIKNIFFKKRMREGLGTAEPPSERSPGNDFTYKCVAPTYKTHLDAYKAALKASKAVHKTPREEGDEDTFSEETLNAATNEDEAKKLLDSDTVNSYEIYDSVTLTQKQKDQVTIMYGEDDTKYACKQGCNTNGGNTCVVHSTRKWCSESQFSHKESQKCVEVIDSANMFLITPIGNSLVVAIISLLFAGMLFKIKSTPVELIKGIPGKPDECKGIDFSKIFKDEFMTNPKGGIVENRVYDEKKDVYSKVLFPYLDETFFPSAASIKKKADKNGGNTYDLPFNIMLPLWLTMKMCSSIWNFPFTALKTSLFKDKWGRDTELSQINRAGWIKDFMAIFIIIPILLLFVFPLAFVFTIVMTALVIPMQCILIFFNTTGGIKGPDGDDEWYVKVGVTILNILKMIAAVIGFFIEGIFMVVGVCILLGVWFWLIFTGMHEKKKDGFEIVKKTWINMVWDYKFIWAALAIGLWASKFEDYLKNPGNVLNFIESKWRKKLPNLIVVATMILLAKQQHGFFKMLTINPMNRTKIGCDGNPKA